MRITASSSQSRKGSGEEGGLLRMVLKDHPPRSLRPPR